MIVVDNSSYVPKDSHLFKIQLEAIRLYCRAKIKSNPKFRVGVATLGWGATLWPAPPTNDVEHFLTHTLENILWGDAYDILQGLRYSKAGFIRIPIGTKLRMLLFVAGPCHGYLTEYVLKIGKNLKEMNVALDVVSLAHEDQEFDALKTICLRSFVASAANSKDHKSHFAHVPRHSSSSSVLDILVSSKILSRLEAQAVPLAEEEMKKETSQKKNKKKKNRTRRRTRKNHHSQDDLDKHSQEDPKEEEALSSSRSHLIIPDYQLPEEYTNRFVFGSLEMHHLIKV